MPSNPVVSNAPRAQPGRSVGWAMAALATLVAWAAVPGCESLNVTELDVAELEVVPGQSALRPGDSLRLTAVIRDRSGQTLTNRDVTWSSEDPSVASVSSNGLVRAHASGETRIRAAAGGAQGSATVAIIAPALLALDPGSVEFEAVERGSSPPSRSVTVTNAGVGTLGDLSASVSYGPGASGWLTAELASATAPTELAFSVTRTDLRPGTYEAAALIESAHAANSPRTVAVRLRIVSRISPSESTITADPDRLPADGESTARVTVRLRAPGGQAIPTGGDDVTLSLSGGGALGPVTDEGDGKYTAVLTAPSEPGEARITGRVNGESLSDDASVEFTPVEEDGPGEPDEPDDPDEPGTASVQVAYHTTGGPDDDRHLRVTVSVRDGDGRPVRNADVVAAIRNRSGGLWVRAGRTDGNGQVVFSVNHHPRGCYVTTVTSVSAGALAWNGETPGNEYCKR